MTENQKSYRQNTSSTDEIKRHLEICNHHFIPPLNTTVDIREYAEKLYQKANRLECWENQKLIGLVAFYCNQLENFNYITNVSVDPNYKNLGIAKELLKNMIDLSEINNIPKVVLEVNKENKAALQLYINLGFRETINQNTEKNTLILEKNIS